MEQPVPIKEVKILETAEDIQERREQVSNRTLQKENLSNHILTEIYFSRFSIDIWSSKPQPG